MDEIFGLLCLKYRVEGKKYSETRDFYIIKLEDSVVFVGDDQL